MSRRTARNYSWTPGSVERTVNNGNSGSWKMIQGLGCGFKCSLFMPNPFHVGLPQSYHPSVPEVAKVIPLMSHNSICHEVH
ncbi:hypothetical protein POPTR_001G093401v4 [Populus trichocarpa]|uniref:Uncharacterized protein n=1 Tax=Populus trichocarpa TaxID=3694 RepID=A0ACC0TIP5_POPTR|nr:hypothetical protein POPTR_001G093401v4 [Populus trichocarpa]